MNGCGKCGIRLPSATVGRRDLCPNCGSELRSCIHCRHYDANVARECKEAFTEPPSDKESANFCDFYQLGEGAVREGGPSRDEVLEAAEALFGPKKPK